MRSRAFPSKLTTTISCSPWSPFLGSEHLGAQDSAGRIQSLLILPTQVLSRKTGAETFGSAGLRGGSICFSHLKSMAGLEAAKAEGGGGGLGMCALQRWKKGVTREMGQRHTVTSPWTPEQDPRPMHSGVVRKHHPHFSGDNRMPKEILCRGRRPLLVTGLGQGRGNHRVGKLIHFVGVGDNKPQLTEGLSVTDVELGCVMGEDHDREQREIQRQALGWTVEWRGKPYHHHHLSSGSYGQ